MVRSSCVVLWPLSPISAPRRHIIDQYLARYRAGECQQVWAELLAQGAALREEPLASDTVDLARETMQRVRHNIELHIRHGAECYSPTIWRDGLSAHVTASLAACSTLNLTLSGLDNGEYLTLMSGWPPSWPSALVAISC